MQTIGLYVYPSYSMHLILIQGLIMGLYGDQECRDIINERRPWEIVTGPSGEVAISSRYAIFYRNGTLDDINATDNFGDTSSVKELYPSCHWIFNIPEGNIRKYRISFSILGT